MDILAYTIFVEGKEQPFQFPAVACDTQREGWMDFYLSGEADRMFSVKEERVVAVASEPVVFEEDEAADEDTVVVAEAA